jgi:hypothetical protein
MVGTGGCPSHIVKCVNVLNNGNIEDMGDVVFDFQAMEDYENILVSSGVIDEFKFILL